MVSVKEAKKPYKDVYELPESVHLTVVAPQSSMIKSVKQVAEVREKEVT
jgi:hypothetical protein